MFVFLNMLLSGSVDVEKPSSVLLLVQPVETNV